MKIAFIGLGVMGFPMAGHLARAGHDVVVYNRSPDKALRWQETYSGRMASSVADAVSGCEAVISCVGNDNDLEVVTCGSNGAFATMAAGTLYVDHSTTSAGLARRLAAQACERGITFLDAPVSGGQSGAEKGVLSIMVGGDPLVFERARPILGAYGRTIQYLGESGSGQLCKMVNQICIAGLVQGLAEAIHFGRSVGLDLEKAMAVIGGGAAQSWQLDNRHKTMLAGQYDFGFAVDWMRKDLGMLLAEAERCGIDLPVTRLVDGFYAEVQAMGGGRWDTSSLLARLSAGNRD